jgi:hypothetical protein
MWLKMRFRAIHQFNYKDTNYSRVYDELAPLYDGTSLSKFLKFTSQEVSEVRLPCPRHERIQVEQKCSATHS